jgi:hypothetical protein
VYLILSKLNQVHMRLLHCNIHPSVPISYNFIMHITLLHLYNN